MGTFLKTDQFSTNQTIKVLINDTSIVLDKSKPGSGLLYDIWKEVRDKLKNRYTFDETIVNEPNYNKLIDMVYQGDADIVIAPFQITKERTQKVDFTITILESKDSIIYFPKNNKLDVIRLLFLKVFLGPIIVLFLFGLFFGTILYYAEPRRYLKASGVNREFAFRRVVVTVTAALFGEAGFLSENTTLSIKGIITMFIVMIFAFFFVMYIQATITEKVIDIRQLNAITRDNIKNKVLIAPKGYAIAKNIERLGAKVIYINKSLDEVIQDYIKDPSIADGVTIDFLEAKSRERRDINLLVNDSELGFKEITFAVSKTKINFLRDLNQEIVSLQDILKTETICKGYMPEGASYLCVK